MSTSVIAWCPWQVHHQFAGETEAAERNQVVARHAFPDPKRDRLWRQPLIAWPPYTAERLPRRLQQTRHCGRRNRYNEAKANAMFSGYPRANGGANGFDILDRHQLRTSWMFVHEARARRHRRHPCQHRQPNRRIVGPLRGKCEGIECLVASAKGLRQKQTVGFGTHAQEQIGRRMGSRTSRNCGSAPTNASQGSNWGVNRIKRCPRAPAGRAKARTCSLLLAENRAAIAKSQRAGRLSPGARYRRSGRRVSHWVNHQAGTPKRRDRPPPCCPKYRNVS